MKKYLAALIIFLIAAVMSQSDPIKVIVGESANQGFKGMVAVGEVIRNRGSLKGMYGLNAKHHEKLLIWVEASIAWPTSYFTDFVKGATQFENVWKFGFPKSWDRERLVCVTQIKDHWFFKEIGGNRV